MRPGKLLEFRRGRALHRVRAWEVRPGRHGALQLVLGGEVFSGPELQRVHELRQHEQADADLDDHAARQHLRDRVHLGAAPGFNER